MIKVFNRKKYRLIKTFKKRIIINLFNKKNSNNKNIFNLVINNNNKVMTHNLYIQYQMMRLMFKILMIRINNQKFKIIKILRLIKYKIKII